MNIILALSSRNKKKDGESVAKRVKRKKISPEGSELGQGENNRAEKFRSRLTQAAVCQKPNKIGNQHVVCFFSFLICLQKREREKPTETLSGQDTPGWCSSWLQADDPRLHSPTGWGGRIRRLCWQSTKTSLYVFLSQMAFLSRLHLDKTSCHGVRISPEVFTQDHATGRRIEGRKKYPMFSVSSDGGRSDESALKTEQNGVQQHSEFCWIILF